MTTRAVVIGCGHYLPSRVVENAEFEKTLDTNDEWIRSRSGIERRHFAAEGQTTSELAANAAKGALAMAGMDADDIDAITAGRGLFFLDPHGPDITKLLDYIPPRRRGDVIYFDPTHRIVAFNPLDRTANHDQTAEALLYAFRDIWRFGKTSTPVFDE